jgi:hypothetical protein
MIKALGTTTITALVKLVLVMALTEFATKAAGRKAPF